jgi:hypothetical protein
MLTLMGIKRCEADGSVSESAWNDSRIELIPAASECMVSALASLRTQPQRWEIFSAKISGMGLLHEAKI